MPAVIAASACGGARADDGAERAFEDAVLAQRLRGQTGFDVEGTPTL